MQLHRGAEYTLQQGIVQVLGDACAFGEPFFKLSVEMRCDPAHTPPIRRPDQTGYCSGAEQNKPAGLVESRSNGEFNRRAFLIPHPIIVASNNSKCILPRRQVIVKRGATGSCFLPILIMAVEFVTVANLLWNNQAERGIVNFKITRSRRKV